MRRRCISMTLSRMTFCIVCMYVDGLMSCSEDHVHVCMYVCSCSTNQCSIVHSSTSWQRCETQVHFNDVVAPPAAEHGSGTDSCMYVCMYVCTWFVVVYAWSAIFGRDTIHQHHDRGVRRMCIWMTLSRSPWRSKPCRGYSSRKKSIDFCGAHLTHRYCNPLIDIMTEMWNTCALEWRCRERFSGFRLMILVLTMGHDQNRASCQIRFVFLCTLWLPTISQSSDRGGSVDGVCVPVNRIISMYVCMYVCKSLLLSMILHSLAGTVEIGDWREQGQDCSHRERGQSSFDMSHAWSKDFHRNHVQGDQGALGIPLRKGRSCWQRFCIFVQPRW